MASHTSQSLVKDFQFSELSDTVSGSLWSDINKGIQMLAIQCRHSLGSDMDKSGKGLEKDVVKH